MDLGELSRTPEPTRDHPGQDFPDGIPHLNVSSLTSIIGSRPDLNRSDRTSPSGRCRIKITPTPPPNCVKVLAGANVRIAVASCRRRPSMNERLLLAAVQLKAVRPLSAHPARLGRRRWHSGYDRCWSDTSQSRRNCGAAGLSPERNFKPPHHQNYVSLARADFTAPGPA
jgi:hypothetical protein